MISGQGNTLRLVDYLVLVGPEQKNDEAITSYCDVPEPVILRQFPKQCQSDCCVCIKQAALFCQPQCTYLLEQSDIRYHTFMLTDTETNKSVYGASYTFPHETKSHDTTNVAKETVFLSVCLISQYSYLNFFQSCLEVLVNLVEKCEQIITWMDLFHPSPDNTIGNTSSAGLIHDIENWIDKLTNLELPASPGMELEITVDLGPPLTLSRPLPNELPLCDLSVRQLFQYLQPHNINEILQLILNEQKVVIFSKRRDIVSKIVLTLVSLLYPLEYVYPMIPLLPARLSQAAEYLTVPVPYIIGTTADLVAEIPPSHLEDVYLVDIDSKEIKSPQLLECLPRLPLKSLELQANIKKILDSLQPSLQVKGSLVVVDYRDKEKVDVLLRRTFLDFMMSPQMLGLLPQHQTIVRLFPRSVVKLQSSSLLLTHNQLLQHESTSFIEKFITSQSVGYFLDWNLNPTNMAYLPYLRLASGKLSLEPWHRVNEVEERVHVSLVDYDSSLYQLLLTPSLSAMDDSADSSSDEDEHQPLLSPWNNQQCFPNMVLPDLRLTKPIVTKQKMKSSEYCQTCQRWAMKLLEGRGMLYVNTQQRQVLGCDSSRTELLLLIQRGLLSCSETPEALWNTKPLEVGSAVFNKLLQLAKLMLQNIGKDFSKNPQENLTSAFVLLHLSCLICLKTVEAFTRKPNNDEITMHKLPVLPCGDSVAPFSSSVSSCASSSDEDDMRSDVCNGNVKSSPHAVMNQFPSYDNNTFLHHDLFIKPLSQHAYLASDEFWKTVYFSGVNMFREKLGWNEKTPELYHRYSSVGNSGQQEMVEKEDELLSALLINLATFMNVAGVCKDRCQRLITSLVMYCRLGHRSDSISSALEEATSGKNTNICPSPVNMATTFVAHLGRNKLGTACKVEVWESVLVLRTLADNEIILRVWRDNIGTSVYETDGELVILHYKDDRQPPVVLHTKQFHQLHTTIIT